MFKKINNFYKSTSIGLFQMMFFLLYYIINNTVLLCILYSWTAPQRFHRKCRRYPRANLQNKYSCCTTKFSDAFENFRKRKRLNHSALWFTRIKTIISHQLWIIINNNKRGKKNIKKKNSSFFSVAARMTVVNIILNKVFLDHVYSFVNSM